MVSRKDISAVTMNMTGRVGLGLTPRYKIDMVKEYLSSTKPDILIVQDCIDCSDMVNILDQVGNGDYEWQFTPEDRPEDHLQSGAHDEEYEDNKCVAAIIWNKKKYIGTSLKQDDKRLGEFVRFLKRNNVAIVKLDSAQRTKHGSEDDVYPSLIAISWLGPDYQVALKDRRATCEHFFKFLTMLRKNNWHIPVLIGGDFNMDMKSFDFQKYYSDFMCVPYRPVSGSLARDLKNTFLFTLDSIQVTETNIKQFHPDVYPNPFITVRVRGRIGSGIKIWAIVKIQRVFRSYLKRAKERRQGNKKLKESKKRWKKKIEGENYVSEPDSSDENDTEAKNQEFLEKSLLRKDENGQVVATAIQNVSVVNYRRKKYADLKSFHEKKKEQEKNESFSRSLRPAERYDF